MSQPPTAHRRTFARINNPIMFLTTPLERHLDRYRRAGFIVSEQIAIWDPGLRSGFVNLWPEDLEIMTVGNEGAFTTGADAQLHSDRSHHGVHALSSTAATHRGCEIIWNTPASSFPASGKDACRPRTTPRQPISSFLIFLSFPASARQ